MKKLSSKSLSTLRYLTFTFIILLILLGLYRFSYIPGREDYFTNRNLRLLSDMSRQLTEIVASYKGQIDKNLVNTKTSIRELEDIKKQVERIRHLSYIQCDTLAGTELFDKEKSRFLQDIIQDIPEQPIIADSLLFASAITYQLTLTEKGYVLQMDYLGKRVNEKDPKGTYSVNLKVQAAVSDIVQPFLKPDIFENILIVENTGDGHNHSQVIYQADQQTFMATRLDSLTKGLKETWASYHGNVTWGNTAYKLFIQPVRLALLGDNSESETLIKDWMLIGLVDSKKFNAEARAISRFQLSQWAFLFFVFLFSVPLIKLYFIGPREELKNKDLVQCVFSFFVLTGLITFWLLSFYSDRKDIDDLDSALKPLAENIEQNLHAELKDIIAQADLIIRDPEINSLDPEKELIPKVFSKEEEIFSSKEIENSPYPYFRQFSWIDATGMQKRKISTRNVITPLVQVKHREYFKKIKSEQAWLLDTLPFYIEPIFSITTGENVAGISVPNDHTKNHQVGMMEVDLMSLMNVTFPKGFGYCIVEANGRVLFHSSSKKNMQENFFVECNNPPGLQASVSSRVEKYMNVNYQGREHRVYTQPIKEIPSWSLITFGDLWMVRSSQLNAISGAVILFIILAVWLPVFLFLIQMAFVLFSQFKWSEFFTWFWPTEANNHKYKLHNTLLFGAAGLHLGLIFVLNPSANLWAAVIFPSLAVLFTFLFFRRRSSTEEQATKGQVPQKQQLSFGKLLLPGVIPILAILGLLFIITGPPVPALGLAGFLLGWVLNLDAVAERIGTAKFPSYYVRYALGGMALFLVTSVMPAIALFKISYDAEKKVLVKSGQFSLLQDLPARTIRIKEELADRPLPDTTRSKLEKKRLNLKNARDIYHRFFFNTQLGQELPLDRTPKYASGIFLKKFSKPLDTLLASRDSTWINRLAGLRQPIRFTKPFEIDALFAWFRSKTRIVDHQTWELYQDQAADSSWYSQQWHSPSYSILLLETHQNGPILPAGRNGAYVISHFNLFSGPPVWSWLIGLSVLMIALFLLLLYFNHQVFGIALILPAVTRNIPEPLETIHQNTIYIGFPNTGKSKVIQHLGHAKIIDLRKLSAPDALDQAMAAEKDQPDYQYLVIDHFDLYWQEEKWNPALLKLLEKLNSSREKTVILVTAIDPTSHFSKSTPVIVPIGSKEKDQPAKPTGEIYLQNRWTMLLSTFTKIYHKIHPADTTWIEAVKKEYANEKQLEQWTNQLLSILLEECRHTPFLQEVGLEILERYPELGETFINEDALIDELLLRSETYYQSIWSLCSVDEKITLLHLARNQFVPYKDAGIVRLLMRKGLVSSRNYRLMNKSFSRFVRTAEPASRVKAWKKNQERSWESIRTPLLTFLLAILAFAFVTQREIFNTSIAWITTVGALIPAILRILTFLEPKKVDTGEMPGSKG